MLKQCLEIFDSLDHPCADGQTVKQLFAPYQAAKVELQTVGGDKGKTDFVRVTIPGTNGRLKGGDAGTLCITGRLGGLGARPEMVGFVSDGDGAVAALAAGMKLADMADKGDKLPGDVIVSTHICPDAPIIPHDPVPMMDSPIDTGTINRLEMGEPMDAVLSIDTTKGNRILNERGIAISSTVKEGYILRVSEDLLNIFSRVTGMLPRILPISMQDITPYGNDIYHINSIMQPATATDAPVVAVAVTAQSAVAGCATGATHLVDVELAARFAVEVAKDFTMGRCRFYDETEFQRLVGLYGSMKRLVGGSR